MLQDIKLTLDTTAATQKLKEFANQLKAVRPFFVRLTDAFSGRCTFFACIFAGVGIVLAFENRLTAEYVALVGAVQALLVVHSAKEDYHERNSDSGDTNASV